jgi:hypothetical protein
MPPRSSIDDTLLPMPLPEQIAPLLFFHLPASACFSLF